MNESAEFINDESKIDLKAGDLFDRIINLRLTCVKTGTKKLETFVIRSDYELIAPDSDLSNESTRKGIIIRRCTYKPSIKVQCKMVTSNVGTSLGITVSNFFMLTADGKHIRSFNASQYKIISVEVVMGYWGQLKDSLDPDTATADDYFNIKAINGADKITITEPIVVTTEKLPPDSALHIKGHVGSIYSSPVAITKINTPVKALSKPVASSGTTFEEILFNNVTRRYINAISVTDDVDNIGEMTKRLVSISDIKESARPVTIDGDGLMSDSDAREIGVKVYVSKQAKKVKLEPMYDGDGNEVKRQIYFEAGWTIGQTISRIMSYMDKELEFTFSLKGDVLIYTPDEMQNAQTLNEAFDAEGLYENTVLANKKLYNKRLPAVYNINVDAVATIVCPFFTFIEPFQYIEFASRYALTSVVSYFASYSPTIHRFLVINASISFATVDDVNEVQITAVSAKESAV